MEGGLLLELKVVDRIPKLDVAKVMSYQKLREIKLGPSLNFNAHALRLGIRRVSI